MSKPPPRPNSWSGISKATVIRALRKLRSACRTESTVARSPVYGIPALSTAAGHLELARVQGSVSISFKHCVDFAADLRHHPHLSLEEGSFEQARNGPADKNFHAQFGEAASDAGWLVFGKRNFLSLEL